MNAVWGRRLGVALLPIFLWILVAGQSSAHAVLTASSPSANAALQSAPAEARLTFSEPLEPHYSRAALFRSDGTQVSTGASHLGDQPTDLVLPLPSGLQPGTYTIQWQNISAADGHPQSGFIPFTIGSATAASPPPAVPAPAAATGSSAGLLDTVGRWLGLLGVAAAIGAFICWLLVLRPALSSLDRRATSSIVVRLQSVAFAGVAVALTGSILLLVAETRHAAGTAGFAALADFLSATRFGHYWLARAGLLLLLALVLASRAPWLSSRRRAAGLTLLLCGVSLLPYVLVSHAAAQQSGRPAALTADWLHLACTAVWVGGLLALLAGLIFNRRIPADERRASYGSVIKRFSTMAMSAVALLVLTGLYASWLEVGGLTALRDTTYGQVLLVKLGLIVPLVVLAALNLLVIAPRIRAERRVAGWFRRAVAAEAILGIAILLVVGVLTGLSPARSADTQPSDHPVVRLSHDGITAVLQLTPGTVGQNRYTVDATRNGRPVPSDWSVLLRFSSQQLEGTREVQLKRSDPSTPRFEGEGSDLSIVGAWQVEVVVRPPDVNDWGAVRTFDIGQVYTPQPVKPSPRFLGNTAALLLLLVAAGVVLVIVGARHRRTAGSVRPALEAGLGLLVIGMATLALTLGTGGDAGAAANPVPPTSDSIARGQALYQQNCAECHGADARGDGPRAPTLTPPPANLPQHVNAHSDEQLFDWISNGIPPGTMPGFKNQLSTEQRWDLINYLHSLTPVAAATPAASPTHQATHSAPVVSQATPSAAPAGAASPAPPVATAASPTPQTPAANTSTWVEVGHWSSNSAMYTDAITVNGPWRIRWKLSGTSEYFNVMIEQDGQTPILLTGPPGSTSGEFLEAQPGTYNLMFHNTIPYEVVVEERR